MIELFHLFKGGLRGKLFMINSTSCSDYIPKDIITSLHEILEKEEVKEKEIKDPTKDEDNRNSENSTECNKGEITEKGLRLRTPLVSKQYTPSLGKFGALISIRAAETPVTFIHYGNW